MKKMFVILVGLVALMQTVQAEDKVLDSSKFEAIKKMNVVLEDPALTIQGVIEQAETYVLKLEAKSPQGSQRITAYLDKSSSNLYIGSAYIKDGHPIFFPKDAAAIKAGVSFSYGTGSKEIYLVTDPLSVPYEVLFFRYFQNLIYGNRVKRCIKQHWCSSYVELHAGNGCFIHFFLYSSRVNTLLIGFFFDFSISCRVR